MKPRALLPLFLLVFVGGCQSMGFIGDKESPPSGKEPEDQAGLQMVLFYDKAKDGVANDHYLDALLEVTDEYPQQHHNITIHAQTDRKLTKQYQLKEQPTLIVTDNGKTKARIEGYNEKNTITKKVKHVIEDPAMRSKFIDSGFFSS